MSAPTVDEDWRLRAACRRKNADWWTVEGGYLTLDNLRAQGICKRICPVRAECDAEYRLTRPYHRKSMIAGGQVYDQHGEPAVNVRTAAPTRHSPARKCHRPTCGAWLPAGCRVDQKYHSADCGKAHRNQMARSGRTLVGAA